MKLDDGREPYVFKEHRWEKRKGLQYQVCRGCGLVALGNPISNLCTRLGCNHDDHPRYWAWLRRVRSGQSPWVV